MSAADCIKAIQAAGRGLLSEDDVAAIAEEVQKRQKRIRDRGAVVDLDGALKKATADVAEQLRLKAALDRRHAALMADARDRVEGQVRTLIAQGMRPDKAVLAVLEGATKAKTAARRSVGATKLAYESRYLGALLDGLARDVPEFQARKGDTAFQANIVREMHELRDGGTPGRTGDKAAAKVAKHFATIAELSRQDLNRLGSYIGKLDGWAGPQAHDGYKIAKVNEADWVAKTARRLDLDRTFPELAGDPDAQMNALGEVYRTIVTGEGRQRSAKGKGEVTGPASMAKGLVKHRVLHFASPDDWLSYAQEFGRGGIVDGMVGHLRHAAQSAGQMHVLGPNPEAMIDGLVETLRKEVRADRTMRADKAAKIVAALDTDGTSIGSAMSVMSGLSNAPVDVSMAKIGSGLRAAQSLAKLGGAVISSVSDLVTGAANMKMNGKPLFAAYSDQLHTLLSGRDRAEAKEIGRLVGEGFDGMLDHIHSAAVGMDTPPGVMAKAQSLFFKASGLTWWTDTMRASQARMLSAWYGGHAGKAFDQLPAEMARTLDRHGLGAAEWDAFRQTAWNHPESGTAYLTPDRLQDVNAQIAWRRFFADEVGFGVLEADAATQRITAGESRRGTYWGEARRFMMQFKGYPIAYAQRVLGRQFNEAAASWHAGERMQAVGNISHLIAMTTVAGYMAQTAKDAIKGYEPRDPTNWKTVLSAMKQGGGMGIYGDFLFGEANRFGGGLLETIAGPVIGDAANLGNMLMRAREGDVKAGDWLNRALQSTPGASLWYVRPALDVLVLNSLRDSISPGFLARQDQKRQKDYGQRRAFAPTIGGILR